MPPRIPATPPAIAPSPENIARAPSPPRVQSWAQSAVPRPPASAAPPSRYDTSPAQVPGGLYRGAQPSADLRFQMGIERLLGQAQLRARLRQAGRPIRTGDDLAAFLGAEHHLVLQPQWHQRPAEVGAMIEQALKGRTHAFIGLAVSPFLLELYRFDMSEQWISLEPANAQGIRRGIPLADALDACAEPWLGGHLWLGESVNVFAGARQPPPPLHAALDGLLAPDRLDRMLRTLGREAIGTPEQLTRALGRVAPDCEIAVDSATTAASLAEGIEAGLQGALDALLLREIGPPAPALAHRDDNSGVVWIAENKERADALPAAAARWLAPVHAGEAAAGRITLHRHPLPGAAGAKRPGEPLGAPQPKRGASRSQRERERQAVLAGRRHKQQRQLECAQCAFDNLWQGDLIALTEDERRMGTDFSRLLGQPGGDGKPMISWELSPRLLDAAMRYLLDTTHMILYRGQASRADDLGHYLALYQDKDKRVWVLHESLRPEAALLDDGQDAAEAFIRDTAAGQPLRLMVAGGTAKTGSGTLAEAMTEVPALQDVATALSMIHPGPELAELLRLAMTEGARRRAAGLPPSTELRTPQAQRELLGTFYGLSGIRYSGHALDMEAAQWEHRGGAVSAWLDALHEENAGAASLTLLATGTFPFLIPAFRDTASGAWMGRVVLDMHHAVTLPLDDIMQAQRLRLDDQSQALSAKEADPARTAGQRQQDRQDRRDVSAVRRTVAAVVPQHLPGGWPPPAGDAAWAAAQWEQAGDAFRAACGPVDDGPALLRELDRLCLVDQLRGRGRRGAGHESVHEVTWRDRVLFIARGAHPGGGVSLRVADEPTARAPSPAAAAGPASPAQADAPTVPELLAEGYSRKDAAFIAGFTPGVWRRAMEIAGTATDESLITGVHMVIQKNAKRYCARALGGQQPVTRTVHPRLSEFRARAIVIGARLDSELKYSTLKSDADLIKDIPQAVWQEALDLALRNERSHRVTERRDRRVGTVSFAYAGGANSVSFSVCPGRDAVTALALANAASMLGGLDRKRSPA